MISKADSGDGGKAALSALFMELAQVIGGAKPEGGVLAFLPPILDMLGDFARNASPAETAALCRAAASAVRSVMKDFRS